MSSGLMKSTEVDESLSTTSTTVLFQRKSTYFKLPNMFGTVYDVLVLGYDSNGRDHDNTLPETPSDTQESIYGQLGNMQDAQILLKSNQSCAFLAYQQLEIRLILL